MKLSRAALIAITVLTATAVGGCGSAHVSPHTNACRSFQLKGGSASPALAAEVIHYLAGASDLSESLVAQANGLRSAAVDAGLTANLGQADYEVFKRLVDALDTFVTSLTAAGDSGQVNASVAAPVQKAVKAADKTCA